MLVRLEVVRELTELVGATDAAEMLRLAKAQDKLEAIWRKKFAQQIEAITKEIISHAKKTNRLDFSNVDFDDVVMEHSFRVMEQGIKSARKPAKQQRLASVPPKIPKTLLELRKMWDAWRKKKKMPARQKEIAERLKKAYCDKVQSVWEKYGEQFREGKTAEKTEAIRQIYIGAQVTESRAKMIVDTETTFYYNNMRRNIYDQSDDVTHYLFMALRDQATTLWCKTRTGLVYAKGDSILEDETPPVHWNCRSELLPLTPLNPVHAKLINDKRKQRRAHRCEPLPPGWGGRRGGSTAAPAARVKND